MTGFGFPLAEQGSKTVSPESASFSDGVSNQAGGTKKEKN